MALPGYLPASTADSRTGASFTGLASTPNQPMQSKSTWSECEPTCHHCEQPETLPHLLCHCPPNMPVITEHHNRIVEHLTNAVRSGMVSPWHLAPRQRTCPFCPWHVTTLQEPLPKTVVLMLSRFPQTCIASTSAAIVS